ncbi:MAG TPA: hypothetical protein VJ046_00705 [Candidatus Paceibacterota bacterium]|nr:hypothetical protein [Candidatus Paceibacterota bacterium]
MSIPDSGFDGVLSKILAGEMRKRVFNQLGAMVNDLPADRLSRDERKEAKLKVLGFIEAACHEFFPEMTRRIVEGDGQPKSVGDRGRSR